ncbi:MAG: DUF4127 family protein [Candidatus Izemoplasmatales bacterium]|nr:DUF4127 family protein [Candidatus Izemoplasmatales bacterium]
MAKIVYIPMDERPCNLLFPQELFIQGDIQMITPDHSILPTKRNPANVEKLFQFLLETTKDAYGLVLSIDMLLYGGLVPSRIHEIPKEVLYERIEWLKQLKVNNPSLIIYAFQVIMRSPQYNGADEEPLYYKEYGRNIYLHGYYQHRQLLGLVNKEDLVHWEKLSTPKEHLDNFIHRRQTNLEMNLVSLQLVKEKLIDFMIMCQDDASEYGFPAMDQAVISKAIKEQHLMLSVYAYSGADELGVIMVSRMVNHVYGKMPKFFLKYPSPTTPMVVPCLEDRALDNTVKYQVLSAGGMIVSSLQEADIVMLVLMGATKMFPRVVLHDREVDVMINLIEAFEFAKYAIAFKPVIVADLIYLNAGSVDVLNLLKESGLLLKVATYAGWNTASNALGTAIAGGIAYLLFGPTNAHYAFLMKRYVEDIGYCGIVRSSVTEKLEGTEFDYFHAKVQRGVVSSMVNHELVSFIDTHLGEIKHLFTLHDVHMPWKRMFEVGFDIQWIGNRT